MLKKYLNKLSDYPRLRVLLIIVVVIFVVIVLFDVFSPSGSSSKRSSIPGSSITGTNPDAETHTSRIGAKRYNEEKKKREQEAYENKIKQGSDVFKGLFGSDTKKTKAAPVRSPVQVEKQQKAKSAPTKSQPVEPPPLSPTQVLKSHSTQQAQVPAETDYQPSTAETPQEKAAKQALEAKYKSALSSQQSKWALPSMTQVGSVPAPTENNQNQNGSQQLPGNVIIKSGTILFAVLENTLNSDQPGTPVLAVIAAGKYRGARLMGTFTREKEKLVVKFTQLITKHSDGAIAISAYAIDPKTAQNALATSVNHHYLERYGSLFAASLIQGFGNAFSNYQNPCQGTNNCFISGSVQRPDVTTKTALYQGLGQIGTNISSNVQNNFNLPVTVKLKRGTGIGILFMGDVRNNPTPYASAKTKVGNLPALQQAAKTLATGINLTPQANNTNSQPTTQSTASNAVSQVATSVANTVNMANTTNSNTSTSQSGSAPQPVQPQF